MLLLLFMLLFAPVLKYASFILFLVVCKVTNERQIVVFDVIDQTREK